MNKMIVANLVYRPIRSLISVLAVAIEVTLILLIVGLSLGMINDAKGRQAGIGYDLMVQPPNSSFLQGLSNAPMPIKIQDKLRTLQYVQAVAPVVTSVQSTTNLEVLYGIDMKSFQAVAGPFTFLSGGPFTGPYSAIVDEFFADQKHAKVGDKLEALHHTFIISGIVEQGKGGRKFFPIETMQDMIGGQGKASIFYIKLTDPSKVDVVQQEIKSIPGMSDYTVRSLREYLSQMTPKNLPGFNIFLDVVIGVAMTIGFIVIFQSMYAAVMERTREIGILKSLGASKPYIVQVILRETTLISFAGIIVGILISAFAEFLLVHKFPTLRMLWAWKWVGYAALLSMIGAMIGAVYPAFKAAAKDPIDALAYE